MSEVVDLEKRGCNHHRRQPPVNALSHAVRSGLARQLAAALEAPEVRSIVLICKGRTFIAGADIKEFGKPPMPPELSDVIASARTIPRWRRTAFTGSRATAR